MRFPILAAVAVGLGLAFFTSAAHADNFYRPLPSAKSAIDFDSRGFLIHGQRTWISSASIHYARVPRALWRDRLLKIKRAGFNCVEIYAFWNFHEIAPGQWDFTGDKDVGAFLDLVHELGLYATVRVGPYCCAEWEDGGFPLWLRFIPGLRVRQNEPKYLAAVDDWYNHIMPIVARHQISRGGSVIMVQLENEDDEGWGAWNLNPVKQAYFKNLLDNARANGIDVLTFFSGMNHGGNPAPKEPNDTSKQPNPWYTTEFWCNWYSQYGAMDAGTLTHFDRAAWRFLQNGAQGFNVYMFHGGSNFGTWNNNETAASYDYGAAIGQAGDLRPVYYKFKRIAYFARSFQDILENANIAPVPPGYDFPGLNVNARTGPAGTLVFLDNPGTAPVDAKFADGQTMTLAPGEITGLARDFALNDGLKLTASEARVLSLVSNGDLTTILIYGPAGSTGSLTISGFGAAASVSRGTLPKKTDLKGQGWSAVQNGTSTLHVNFPAKGVSTFSLTDGGSKNVEVLAMSSERADDTYFVETYSENYFVSGAPYVGDFYAGKAVRMKLELPLNATEVPAVAIFATSIRASTGASVEERFKSLEPYGPYANDREGKPFVNYTAKATPLPPLNLTDPTLTNLACAPADAEAAPGYDDSKWLSADSEKQREAQTPPGKIEPRLVTDPPAMGADLDGSAYAWYRVKIHADAAGTKYLQIPFVGDQAYVFLNGKRTGGTVPMGPQTIPLDLKAGDNLLAILTSHNGRNKLGSYGSVAHLDTKGLTGPVRLLDASVPLIPLTDAKAQDWWGGDHPHPPVEQLVAPGLDTSDVHWGAVNFRANYGGQVPAAWRSPFVCIRATLPDIAGPNRTLHIGMFDEKATFYLNGQKLLSVHNDHWNAAVPNQYNPAPDSKTDDQKAGEKAVTTALKKVLIEDSSGPQGQAEQAGASEQPGDFATNGSIDLPLDGAWKDGGPNQLTIILENSHAQATVGIVYLTTNADAGKIVTTNGVPGIVRLNLGAADSEVHGWKMRGGVSIAAPGNWRPGDAGSFAEPDLSQAHWREIPSVPVRMLNAAAPSSASGSSSVAPASGSDSTTAGQGSVGLGGTPTWPLTQDKFRYLGGPRFTRAQFTLPADFEKDATPVLRLSTKGLSRGFAWLNGHNLGRYPEKVPVDGLYLPECWLQPGQNELLVLDEEGNLPTPQQLYIEPAASRRIVER